MRSPSMIGVGEAKLFFGFVSLADFRRNTSTFWRIAPLFRSIEIARSDFPSSVAVVSQMRSPWTTGDDQPFPGIATFQRTFLFSLHVNGSPVSSETPCPVGPRNCGQSEVGTNKMSNNKICVICVLFTFHQPNIRLGSDVSKVNRAVVSGQSRAADINILIGHGQHLLVLS